MIVDPKISHIAEYLTRIRDIHRELLLDADLLRTVYVLDAINALEHAQQELIKAQRKIALTGRQS